MNVKRTRTFNSIRGYLKNGKSKKPPVIFVSVVLLAVVFLTSVSLGRYSVAVDQIFAMVWVKIFGGIKTWPSVAENIIFAVRLPRIFAALIIGAALASSGAAYQGLFRNPMISPDILGASAGASFGATVAILLSLNTLGVEVMAFICGLCGVGLTCMLSSVLKKGHNASLILVLTGMVVGNLFTAFTSLGKFVADPNSKLPEIIFWLMGGLAAVTDKEVFMLIVPFVLGIVPLLLLGWRINVMSFGDEECASMGVDVRKVRIAVIICATFLTSASIAVGGMIQWVGLIVPHMARLIVGPNHRVLIPASMIMGGTFLMLVDDITRSVYTAEIPLSIATSIIGAPFFIFLLMKEKRG